MLKERIQARIYERGHGLYRNAWFLVRKQEAGKYRLVYVLVVLNKYTIRDTNMPLNLDDFAESFTGC